MTTVCLPWRATPDRVAAFERCTQFWRSIGFNVVTGDSDPEQPFLCCEARNNAVRQANSNIVIVADADTLPESTWQIKSAVMRIAEGIDKFVWPFTIYRYIAGRYVDESDLRTVPIELESYDSPGGIVVAQRRAYWRLGGYPQGFVPGENGFDDTAFLYLAQTLNHTSRIPGTVYSFNHATVRNYTETNPNYVRFKQFEDAYEDPVAMRRLIRT